MRKLLALFVLSVSVCFAQNRFPPINIANSDPTGTACSVVNALQQYTSHIYICTGGTWQAVGGGASGPVVPSPQFSLFYQPSSGTAAVAQGDSNITTDGSGNFKAVTGVFGALGTGSVSAATVGGSRYPSRWGDGSTNGIASAVGTGQNVIVSPAYPNTEHYTYASSSVTQAPAAVQSHVLDWRNGSTTETCRDPIGTLLDGFNNCYTINLQNYTNQGPNGGGRPHAMQIYANFNQPSLDFGTPAVGPGGWTVGVGLNMNINTPSVGIHEGMVIQQFKTGIGDSVGGYFYNTSYGGQVDGSAEGNHGVSWHGDEAITTFKGTVATGGGGSGATTVKITCTVDCNGDVGGPGQGRYIMDFADQRDTGEIVSRVNKSGSTPLTLQIDHSITPSIAIGLLTSSCNTGAFPTPIGTGYNTVTCTVNQTGGTGVFTASPTSLVCFNGTFHEQAIITNVSGSGPYTLTMNLRHAHQTGTMIAQGPPCGTFIDFTSNDVTTSGVLQHFPIDVLGAPDATHYYTSFFYVGADNGSGAIGGLGSLLVGQNIAATNLTNIGGVVYMTTTINGNTTWLVGGTVQISGATVSGYNGACTNSVYSPATLQLRCTQASSAGLGLSASATLNPGTSQYGFSNYTVIPGAEVLDTMDRSVNPPVASNNGVFTLTTEPNDARWSDADAVEQPHHYALRVGAIGSASPQNRMLGSSEGLTIGIGGNGATSGVSGGGLGGNLLGFQALLLDNVASPTAMYTYHGGDVNPPGGIVLKGLWNYAIAMNAPEPFGSSVIGVGCPVSGCSDPAYSYNMFSAFGNATNGSSAGLLYKPNGNSFSTTGNWIWQSEFGKQTFRDSLTFGVIGVPTLATPTTSATGGNLTAATYFYTVFARNNTGLGLQSTEKSVVVASGTTNSNILSWTHVQGATQYLICRGTTTGTETLGPSLAGIDSLNYVDNGSNTFTGGACNTTDTTRAGTDNAAYAGIENANGTTQTKIGPGAATTAITISLPETGTVGSLVDKLAGATVVGRVATFSNVTGRIQDSGTLLSALAPLASPTFTGTPAAPTPATADSSTTLATTAFVKAQGYTLTIASGTATMTTVAIAAGACGTTVTVAATNTATTDAIAYAYNAAVAANPGVLILNRWPTAGNVNFAYCNPTAASVTPTAATLNWRVTR